MAEDIVKRIKEAEREADEIIKNAEKETQKIISDKIEALEKEYEAAEQEEKIKTEQFLNEAKKQEEEKYKKAMDLSNLECDKLKKRLLEKKEEAVRLTVEKILKGA